MTGILRERLNISLIDARWMRGFTSLKDLLMIKTVQNRNMYVRDYITAMPIERNITTYKVTIVVSSDLQISSSLPRLVTCWNKRLVVAT